MCDSCSDANCKYCLSVAAFVFAVYAQLSILIYSVIWWWRLDFCCRGFEGMPGSLWSITFISAISSAIVPYFPPVAMGIFGAVAAGSGCVRMGYEIRDQFSTRDWLTQEMVDWYMENYDPDNWFNFEVPSEYCADWFYAFLSSCLAGLMIPVFALMYCVKVHDVCSYILLCLLTILQFIFCCICYMCSALMS